jgi:regulatory protein
VRQELLHKGVAPEAVAEALAGLSGSEFERALEVWRQRFGTLPQDAAERAKQMRFLLARGFASAVVAKVLRYDPNE